MYHDIRERIPGVSGGPEHFAVSRDDFAAQLDQIVESGYLGCSVAQALTQPDELFVAMTFDDGDAGQYENAFPELLARSMTATFFVTTNWVGRDGYVDWNQLRDMHAAGMSIQSHTRSHPFLSELDSTALEDELAGAKAKIDAELGQETTMVAFPGGDPPRRRCRHLIGDAGYSVVATSRWGANREHPGDEIPLYLRRCTIRGAPSLDFFRRVLSNDPRIRMRRYVRESTLRALRTTVGRTRYARWRARFLDRVC